MARNDPPKARVGGRGCPSCGSHDTQRLVNAGAQWCDSCGHRWIPCKAHCRGFVVEVSGDFPQIKGCKECGVPDKFARWWPEAYRTVYKKLSATEDKLKSLD